MLELTIKMPIGDLRPIHGVSDGRFTFGVVGACGATGQAVVAELHKSCGGNVLIGGRELEKQRALADRFDARVSATQVDVLDPASLDAFCGQCAIIINCAGPVCRLEDRVAQAALRNGCHYVDPAGLTIVEERMRAHSHVVADAGLCFVISAGWMPGLTELLPVYAHARAKATMDAVESIAVYFADGGDWSRSALIDGAWFLRRRGLSHPMYFSRGHAMRATSAQALRKVNLGPSIASGRFGLYWTPEMEGVGRRLSDCDVLSYSYVSGIRTIAASLLLASVPLPERAGIDMIRGIFQRNRFAAGGFAVVEARGISKGRRVLATTTVSFERGRDYWFHATTLATVARLIADRKDVEPGVHFLAGAVEPTAFAAELQRAGIQITESVALEPPRGSPGDSA